MLICTVPHTVDTVEALTPDGAEMRARELLVRQVEGAVRGALGPQFPRLQVRGSSPACIIIVHMFRFIHCCSCSAIFSFHSHADY